VVPFLVQFLLFITPVIYPVKMIPGKWQLIYFLNPMAGVIEGFRWAWLGVPADPQVTLFLASTGMALIILISGLFYFRRMERLFADMI
jgi:lipopolysaccharide transport system permease protein